MLKYGSIKILVIGGVRFVLVIDEFVMHFLDCSLFSKW